MPTDTAALVGFLLGPDGGWFERPAPEDRRRVQREVAVVAVWLTRQPNRRTLGACTRRTCSQPTPGWGPSRSRGRPRHDGRLLPRRRRPDGADERGRDRRARSWVDAIVVLEHAPAMRHAAPHEAGLFHTAILFDTQADLAAALVLRRDEVPADLHGQRRPPGQQRVLLPGPEGNGVELYWDRDRTEWSWTHGMVDMATFYVDPNAFVQEHLTSSALEAASTRPGRVGHVHLSVGDVATAKAFYVDRLGFATTAAMGRPGAVRQRGRVPHHMAMNTWNSPGRAPAAGTRARARADRGAGARTTSAHSCPACTTPGCRPRTTVGPWRSRTRGRTASR